MTEYFLNKKNYEDSEAEQRFMNELDNYEYNQNMNMYNIQIIQNIKFFYKCWFE